MGIGRLNLPAVVVTGGVMEAGPDLLTLEQIGMYSAMYQRGEISEDKFLYYKHHAWSILRSMFVYGNGINHADHGGSARTYDPGDGADACDL